jgi:hypothetical protein
MFVAGAVGVVATVVLASRATLKLEALIDNHELDSTVAQELHDAKRDDYTDLDYKKDRVVIHTRFIVGLAKLYGPAVVMGIASIAALTGSHVVLNRRYMGVTAAYAALEKGYNEYRKRVTEELGEDKDRQFRYGLTDKEIVEEDEHGTKLTTIKGLQHKDVSVYGRFFDESSTSWSREPGYNQIFLRCQQQYMNDLLNARGHVFLNEVFDALGLSRTSAGAVVGWVKPDSCQEDGDGYVDFGIFRGDVFMAQEFVNGNERSILLDFNVDGVIYDKI